MPGQEAVQAVNGPLARTLGDVVMYSQAVIDSKPWLHDPKCLPIPWRRVELPDKLNIGVMWNDGMVQPTPPVTRALKETAARLSSAGHNIVEWDPRDQSEGMQLLRRMFVADGGKTIRHELQRTGEPWREEMYDYSVAEELGTSEMWKLHLERTAFQNRYLDRWNAAGLDAILCPTTAYSTTQNGSFRHGEFQGHLNAEEFYILTF
jgi:amidase